MTPAPHGPVLLDLQASQSPTYRERGVARYSLDFARALAAETPDVLDQVLLRADLGPVGGLDALLEQGVLTTKPDWDRPGAVFHVLSPFDLATPVRRIWPRPASAAGMRLVVTVYDLIPELFPEIYLTDPGTRARYRARRELVRAADHVVTLSRSAADDVVAHLGVPEERVSVVGAACSEVFSPAPDPAGALREARALVPGLGAHSVVYNGAVEPRKNIEGLLEAFAHLPEQLRHSRQLVLVCRLGAPERHHLEVRAEQLGIAGALLLTGQVADDALVALYRSCELVVFPSLYEGYGLPVVEAMASGAPVVASGTSSLVELVPPEATFDPRDTVAMAASIERALIDGPLRQRLLAWSERPRPTWREVARRAGEVYERLAFESAPPRTRRAPAAWRRRPRVALLTPWPPALTGVAFYSERLAQAMAESVDVDLFIDGDQTELDDRSEAYEVFAGNALADVESSRGGYDAVIACVGNSEHHASALKLVRLRRYPATVLAHDVRLTGLYRHGEARGAIPEGYAAALATIYPSATPDWMDDGWVPPAKAAAHGIFMARELIAIASHFVVTSEFAGELARLDARESDRDKVLVCPFAYPDPVRPKSPGGESGLVCSFGLVNEAKLPRRLLEAFALVLRAESTARLVFVGPGDPGELAELADVGRDLGLGESVVFTGEVDSATYEDWLGRAAVAIQLRGSTNGETSAAVADCLSHGVATVVTGIGPARDLPGFVEKVAVEVGTEELAAVIGSLLTDHARRVAASEDALAYASTRSFAHAASQLLEIALDGAARQPVAS